MSGILTPGERGGQWQIAGDHDRRIRALEAVNDCCDDIPEGLLAGCAEVAVDFAMRSPGDLTAWWRMGDDFTFGASGATVSDALDDVSEFDSDSPRYLDYHETSSASRPTLDYPHTELGTADDGSVDFNVGAGGSYFTAKGGSHSGSVDDITEWGTTFDKLRTVVCYIQPGASSATPRPMVGWWGMDNAGSLNEGWIIDIESLVLNFKGFNDGGGPDITLSTPGALTAGQWYAVAVTWDGATWSLYLNGILVDSEAGTTAPTLSADSEQFCIGFGRYDQGISSVDLYGDGAVDEVATYKKTLSPTEVAAIATATGTTTGTVFCAATIDSTENVGESFGVHSEDPDGTPEDPITYLGADGSSGSTWRQVAADEVSFSPSSLVSAADVQSAIEEVAAATGGGGAVDVQEFSANGTWSKPSGATWVEVILWGGGGGGGAGRNASPPTSGGTGGGGGGCTRQVFKASDLTSSVTVTIATAGTGGVTNGAAGGVGGNTTFGAYASACGGGGGEGGQNGGSFSGGSGGSPNAAGVQGTSAATAGGGVTASGAKGLGGGGGGGVQNGAGATAEFGGGGGGGSGSAGAAGGGSIYGGAGGGGGGCISGGGAAVASAAGGPAGNQPNFTGVGGPGGTAGPTATIGGSGTAGDSTRGGSGGGGGGARTTAGAAGAGGVGGARGGGGGGGGSGNSPGTFGAGGNGGVGYAIVTSW